MAHKSFQTYTPTEGATFDVNGTSFRLNPSIPGPVLLDFLEGADESKPSEMAKILRDLMQAAIVPEDLPRWDAFTRDPANNVTLNLLSEIAGYVTEKLSGNPTEQSPMPYMGGSPVPG